MDFFDVKEIADGLIKSHRVYWGWRGVEAARHELANSIRAVAAQDSSVLREAIRRRFGTTHPIATPPFTAPLLWNNLRLTLKIPADFKF